MTIPLAPWRRPPPDPGHQPVVSYPKPPAPDPGPPAHNLRLYDGLTSGYNPGLWAQPAAGMTVAYAPPPAPRPPRPVPLPAGAWRPAGMPAPAPPSRPAGPGRAVVWSAPPPKPAQRPAPIADGAFRITAPELELACGGDGINYDPPPEAAGTGLQATNPDGSWVVHPLSVIHPGSQVGDEGPINEAFLSTPVVYLCAGRPYMLSSPVVIPDGATLYLNRAAIDRTMIHPGAGATIYD